MSRIEPRPEERAAVTLDVPVAPVAGSGRRDRSRSRVLAVVVAVAGVVGLGVLGELGDSDRPATALVPAPATTRPPAEAASASPAVSPTGGMRPEMLPELDNRPLPEAPIPVFHRRTLDDLDRYAWLPGTDALTPIEPIRGAFAGVDASDPGVTVLSPDGTIAAVRTLSSFSGGTGDLVRLLDLSGRELWSTDDAVGFPIAPIWSPNGRQVVLPGPTGVWRIVSIADGSAVETTIDTRTVPGLAEIAGALPTAAMVLTPVGFSSDGRYLYAIQVEAGRPGYRPAARVTVATGSIEAVERFPRRGPEALEPIGRLGYEVDPGTGRRFVSPGLGIMTGPTTVRAFESDGSEAFSVEMDTVIAVGWAGDGRLLAIETDTFPEPSQTRLVAIEPAGTIGEPLLETGPLTWASLAGVRDGHALLALSVSGEHAAAEAIMVRVSDGRTAVLPLSVYMVPDLQFAGWLP